MIQKGALTPLIETVDLLVGQSVAESDVAISREIRTQIAVLMADGLSDEEIRTTIASGYDGDIRYNWNAPILVSPHDCDVVFHAGNMLLRSEFLLPAVPFTKMAGQPFRISEIRDRIETLLNGGD